MIASLENMVFSWVENSYTTIYYLEPLPFQEDNKRPPDAFRMATHANLKEIIKVYNFKQVEVLDRSKVISDVFHKLGISKNSVAGEDAKWQAISEFANAVLLVKPDDTQTGTDVDAWVLVNSVSEALAPDLTDRVQKGFSLFWNKPDSNEVKATLDLMVGPADMVSDPKLAGYKLYKPKPVFLPHIPFFHL
jgi:hypothetical protein